MLVLFDVSSSMRAPMSKAEGRKLNVARRILFEVLLKHARASHTRIGVMGFDTNQEYWLPLQFPTENKEGNHSTEMILSSRMREPRDETRTYLWDAIKAGADMIKAPNGAVIGTLFIMTDGWDSPAGKADPATNQIRERELIEHILPHGSLLNVCVVGIGSSMSIEQLDREYDTTGLDKEEVQSLTGPNAVWMQSFVQKIDSMSGQNQTYASAEYKLVRSFTDFQFVSENFASLPRERAVSIVGPVSSGKTVLLAMIAYEVSLGSMSYLTRDSPQTLSAQKYVTDLIDTLRMGEWPAPTRSGETQGEVSFEIRGKILQRVVSGVRRFSIPDLSGETFDMLFGAHSPAWSRTTGDLRQVLQSIAHSAAFVIVVDPLVPPQYFGRENLRFSNFLSFVRDFRNLGGKGWLDVPILVVLAKCDQVPSSDLNAGPEAFVAKNLKETYGLLKNFCNAQKVRYLWVSSVGKVEVVDAATGKTKPPKYLRPVNVDKVIQWCLDVLPRN